MKSSFLQAFAAAAALALVPSARADQFTFSFSGGSITSCGSFSAFQTATPGMYDITGIGGTFSDTSDGISGIPKA